MGVAQRMCGYTQSGLLASPQGSFSLRLVTREKQAEVCQPNCHMEMPTWGQGLAYLPGHTVRDHLSLVFHEPIFSSVNWT